MDPFSFNIQSIYTSYVYAPLHNTITNFKSVIDIIIILDRIANFKSKIESVLKNCRPKCLCFYVFIIVLLVNLPYFLAITPVYFNVEILETKTQTDFMHFGTSKFAKTKFGFVLSVVVIFFKYVLLGLIEFSLNIVTICLFRKFMLKKQALKLSEQNLNMIIWLKNVHKITGNSTIKSKLARQSIFYTKSVETNLIIMVTFLGLVSVIYQALSIGFNFSVLYHGISFKFGLVQTFVSIIRNASYFLIFYMFNKKFRALFSYFKKDAMSNLNN